MFRKYLDPVDLSTSTVQLRERGVAEVSTTRGAAGAGLWTVALTNAENDRDVHADVWECHPTGDEVLCILAGTVRLYFRDHARSAPVATLRAGEAVIVPAGAWHRLEIVEPIQLLAITPRVETRHERVSFDQDKEV